MASIGSRTPQQALRGPLILAILVIVAGLLGMHSLLTARTAAASAMTMPPAVAAPATATSALAMDAVHAQETATFVGHDLATTTSAAPVRAQSHCAQTGSMPTMAGHGCDAMVGKTFMAPSPAPATMSVIPFPVRWVLKHRMPPRPAPSEPDPVLVFCVWRT